MLQSITDIAEICAHKNINRAVISPGSRNAPLTLAFSRNKSIETFVIPDERSAGFIALGMAQQANQLVVLICTSGSAVYNYAPAVAEAFYNHIPMIILSADRPPEWIDQRDGQTIRQSGIFGRHVKRSYSFPDSLEHEDQIWHGHRMINEAINSAMAHEPGPVHINVPLREPFYPEKGKEIKASEDIRIIHSLFQKSLSHPEQVSLAKQALAGEKNILVVAGQGKYDDTTLSAIQDFSGTYHAPIVADVISNCGHLENSIIHQDLFLHIENNELAPDLLITFGKSVISKNLKLFLREFKPQQNWHIGTNEPADTFQSLTRVIDCDISSFFKEAAHSGNNHTQYLDKWNEIDQLTENHLSDYVSQSGFWELTAVSQIMEQLPQNSILHLANSMPVRWANFLGNRRSDLIVEANRGTSGIDGCLSTALGCALTTDKIVTVLLGDMSFLYDRNGLWHNYLPNNLRIVVLNNQGGGIFRLIKGPSDQPELDEFFETHQSLTCQNTIQDFDIEYLSIGDSNELSSSIHGFFEPDEKCKLMEIFTDSKVNQTKYQELKNLLPI